MKVSPQGIEFITYLDREHSQLGFYWRVTHISIYEECVNNAITVPLKQCQFDALVSVCLITRPAEFKRKRLVKYINQGLNNQFIADEFRRINKSFRRVKINWKLVWRRKKEMEYYFGKTVGYEDKKKKRRKR
jgi:GH24 family phage-related lysozyme (muramidase)